MKSKTDLSQCGCDRVHGGEPGQGRWLVWAPQHQGVSSVGGVQLQLSGGGDKQSLNSFNLSVITGLVQKLLEFTTLNE